MRFYSSLFTFHFLSFFFCYYLVQIFCPAENNWPQTRAGTMHFIPCGNDLFGFIRRPCSLDGVWGDVIADTCCRNITIITTIIMTMTMTMMIISFYDHSVNLTL